MAISFVSKCDVRKEYRTQSDPKNMPPADNSRRICAVRLCATAGGSFWINAMKTNEQVLAEWSSLAPPMKKLIQKSRINMKKGGVIMPPEWLYGSGELHGSVCMFRDLGPRPSPNHKLSRYDTTKPHSAENSHWKACGRPPVQIEVAGKVLDLATAARLSGLGTDAFMTRKRQFGAESAMLTPSHARRKYPERRANEFLRSIDLYSDEALSLIAAERRRFGEEQPVRTKDRTHADRLATLLGNKTAKRIVTVAAMPIREVDRVRLLAFYCSPCGVRKSTNRIRQGIIQRCSDPNSMSYQYYGGRGIGFPVQWADGSESLSPIEAFVVDVGFQQSGMELDRIDNDGHYSASNCRWVTRSVNIRNTFRAQDIADRLNAMVEAKLNEILTTAQPNERGSLISHDDKFSNQVP